MTPDSYRRHLDRLEFTQEEAGEYFGYSKRTGQSWAAEGPPKPVAMAMVAAKDRKHLDRLRRRADNF